MNKSLQSNKKLNLYIKQYSREEINELLCLNSGINENLSLKTISLLELQLLGDKQIITFCNYWSLT